MQCLLRAIGDCGLDHVSEEFPGLTWNYEILLDFFILLVGRPSYTDLILTFEIILF